MSATVDFNQYQGSGLTADRTTYSNVRFLSADGTTYNNVQILSADGTTYSNVRVLSADGRIGRFEYFFYSLILPFLVFWIVAALAGIVSHFGELGGAIAYVLLAAAFCAAVIIHIQLTVQRCHDFNATGWLALLLVVLPLASVLFWLIPGSKANNRFGYPPRPSSSLLRKGAALLLLILVAIVTFFALNYSA